MIPLPTDPKAWLHVAHALDVYVQRVGRDRLPVEFVALAEALAVAMSGRPGTPDASAVVAGLGWGECAVMTRAEVAAVIGRSKRTVSRYADEGKIDRVGRGYSAASVGRLIG